MDIYNTDYIELGVLTFNIDKAVQERFNYALKDFNIFKKLLVFDLKPEYSKYYFRANF